jgi:hypothetical protein
MNLRKRIAALMASSGLVLGLLGMSAGAVLADPTPASDQGVTPTSVGGNITLTGEGNNDKADCDEADGIETGDSGGSDTSDNGVTVTWTYDGDSKEFGFTATGGLVTIAYVKGGNGYNIYDYTGFAGGGVAWDGGMFAPDTNDNGDPQGLSHAVFCTGPGQEESQAPSEVPPSEAPPSEVAPSEVPPTEAPSFEQSEAPETEAPSEVPPSEVPPSEVPPSEVPPTEAPSFEQSQAGETDVPTLPNTATIGGNNGSGPSSSAWMLVLALGLLLGSVVVMTPAPSKTRR